MSKIECKLADYDDESPSDSHKAAELLRDAADLIDGARASDCGSFARDLEIAADHAGTDKETVARAMCGIKKARLEHQNYQIDIRVDYLGCVALMLNEFGHL